MNSFGISGRKRNQQGGFSLVEATFSIGLLSFGILSLAPLLAFGIQTSGTARQDRISAQIASTLVEEAKQGTLGSGTVYFDFQGNNCSAAQAAFVAQTTSQTLVAPTSRLAIRVLPMGSSNRARTYAVVFQAP
jgi:Tfp pilus assembly protein PilV